MTNHNGFDENSFDERNPSIKSVHLREQKHVSDCQAEPCCSTIQRDRFELLSAYLDGEVTATEKRQVEEWLSTDPQTQRLYSRLLTLRQNLQMLPVTTSEQSVDQLVERVSARIERQPRRIAWTGLAAAGLLIGILFNTLPREQYTPSIADSLAPSSTVAREDNNEGLMIALNRPPIALPQSALLDQLDTVEQQLKQPSTDLPNAVDSLHKANSTLR
jgi:hypothetical protein